tara:strand:+ start:82 stop:288 length:207 start_codon:yes stop_codon:yes gene_type:complete
VDKNLVLVNIHSVLDVKKKTILKTALGRKKEMKLSEFRKKFGEGTDFDLDYGKLFIIGLCIYIAIQVS